MTRLQRLQDAYNSEHFRKEGHQLIDKLADHLQNSFNDSNKKTLLWNPPEDELEFWKTYLESDNSELFFDHLIQHSINIHNPKYIGHQISPPLPLMGLTGLTMSVLNNGMGIYEMGVAGTAVERIVTDLLCKYIGFTDQSSGFLTAGGTLANLTAMLSARKAKVSEDVWKNGTTKKLAVMVSDQAHYCIERAVRIMGLGDDGLIKVPTNEDYTININLLETYYDKALAQGIEVFAIVGSAPSTATGIYDDLQALAEFSKVKNLWFHVDAAHGGGVIFSEVYKSLLDGTKEADSVVIDGHKMLMMPALTTALLFKDENHSYETFIQKADYLLEISGEKEWYNLAKRTFECTKHMMSIHWYAIIKHYGISIFDDFVTTLYDSGKLFAQLIKKDPHFEIATQPMSNIVCFRYIDSNKSKKELDNINQLVRKQLLEGGEFYILQTQLKGITYLRCSIMNPFTNETHFKTLLSKIKALV